MLDAVLLIEYRSVFSRSRVGLGEGKVRIMQPF